MRTKWLCGFLALVLVLGMIAVFPTQVSAASALVSSDKLVEYLKSVEGFSAKPYWDYGQWTVGYGTECPDDKLDEYNSKGITEEAAMALLKEELKHYEEVINAFIDKHKLKLEQHQFDALITFSYNCGSMWTTETDGYFYKAVLSGDKGNAFIYAMGLWSTAGGEFILMNRRMSEANMYINGEYKAYNGKDKAFPDTYRWVFLAGCGGTPKYRVFAYKSDAPVALEVPFKDSPKGYTFAGWYTADGKKVEKLDGTCSRDQVLYARWKDGNGLVQSLSEDGPVTDLTVTVTREDINLRSGPGTHAAKSGTATKGDKLAITEIYTTTNYVWGRSPKGWVNLGFTDFSGLEKLNGWVKEDGKWVYYVDNKKATNTWVQDSKGWCYLGADGYIVTDKWVKDAKGWRYAGADGYMVTNKWLEDSQGWCYVGKDGYCLTAQWVKDSKGWCYLDENGRMVYDRWVKDSQGWAYADQNGYRLVSCWKEAPEGMRYIGEDGYAIADGWFEEHYFDKDGIQVLNGWFRNDDGWFYMDADGNRLVSCWKEAEEGLRYIGDDGFALVSCWFEGRYLDENGLLVTDRWFHDGTGWCCVDAEGYRWVSCWLEAEGGLRYLNEEGYALLDTWYDDGTGSRYLDAEGYLVVNKWVALEGQQVYAGPEGYVLRSLFVHDGIGWI